MSDQNISGQFSVTYDKLPNRFRVGKWLADARTGELREGGRLERLEPKVMDLLRLFAAQPGQVLGREQILSAIWPDVVVADDALARAMFKLRRALGDDAKAARYLETLPKRGYRLIAEVEAAPPVEQTLPEKSPPGAEREEASTTSIHEHVAHQGHWFGWSLAAAVIATIILSLAWVLPDLLRTPNPDAASEDSALIERADDFYYRYSRADNEAAIELYERILAREPERVEALRGLANALVQRMIRWPSLADGKSEAFTTLTASLVNGHMREPASRRILERAELLARRAIALEPADSLSQRALGLTLAAQSRLNEAIDAYRAAVALDTDAWGALINISEAYDLTGNSGESLAAMISAHEAMTRRYSHDKQHIQPYYAELAVLIGKRLVEAGQSLEGESWFRRALVHSPLHPGATLALARLLETSGRLTEAVQLCIELNARVGEQEECGAILHGRAHPPPQREPGN